MKRRALVASQGVQFKQGLPCPCFTPDFTSDNRLYKEIDSLNEISVAQSNSSLKDICNFRLRPITINDGIQVSDDVIMANIIPKSIDNGDLLAMAHDYETQILNENNDN